VPLASEGRSRYPAKVEFMLHDFLAFLMLTAIAPTEDRSRLPTKVKKCYRDVTPTTSRSWL
jgi:hypothetical protein